MPKHAGGMRCLPQSRRRHSTSVSRARSLDAPPIHAGPRPESIGRLARRHSTSDRGASPAPIRFSPDNFKHSLTLFSKSFSSFPCGTFSLSVSRPYLALDRIHRPIWAAFPNNLTRRQRLVVRQGPGMTGLSPSTTPPSRGLGPGTPLRTLLQTIIRMTEPPDSKSRLFSRVIPPDLGSRSERLCAKGSSSPGARRAIAATAKRVELQPPLAVTSIDVDSHLGQPRARGIREASIRPTTTACPVVEARCEGAMRCMMPRRSTGPPDARRGRGARGKLSIQVFLGAFRARVHWSPTVCAGVRALGTGGGTCAECRSTPPARTPQLLKAFAGSFCCTGFDNDSSAGSPMETLLRVLLPLNDKVKWTSDDVAGSEPPMSPRSKHFIESFNR
ncbi:Protein TAR1 [Capsicum baccatum]|uniref:Protein TAR1 n=1 Tax=Capsicum baccatum TaxID=33114 RepID=A0A2G2V992_CAPBA|nr:Protein TAR1 [Capsicum baccatum]